MIKIACGANDYDTNWTEVLMRDGARYMDALTLHYYTIPNNWQEKGSATEFGERDWFVTLRKAIAMDELLDKHETIMDKYDPKKRVALIVDEWGTWFDVEPGTNPGFLYQQNTMRDALVAALTLHIFHDHCDRVQMANIAQTVNVLQSVVLTEGASMILTPTYHVFDMFQVHQDAEALDLFQQSAPYEMDGESIPQLSASASRSLDGTIHVSLCNVHHDREAELTIELRGMDESDRPISGTVLRASEIKAHNTFDQPDTVRPVRLTDIVRNDDGTIRVKLPPASVGILKVG